MPAWDNVTLPLSPREYGPSLDIGKSVAAQLSALPDSWYQGSQRARQLELQKPILDPDTGKPITGSGPNDYNTIMSEILRRGGAEAAGGILPWIMGRQVGQQISDQLKTLDDFSNPPASGSGGRAAPASPAGAGPGNLSSSAVPNTPFTSSGFRPVADNNGQDTLRSIATETGFDFGSYLPRLSQALGVGLDQPLSGDQVQQLRPKVEQAAQNIKAYQGRAGVQLASDSDTNQPPQATSAAEVNGNAARPIPSSGATGSPAPAPGTARETASPSAGIRPNAPRNPSEIIGQDPEIRRLAFAAAQAGRMAAQYLAMPGGIGKEAAAIARNNQMMYEQRRKERAEFLLKNMEMTDAEKNARSAGLPSSLAYEAATEMSKSAAKNTELSPAEKEARASGVESPLEYKKQEAENAARAKNLEMTTEEKLARASSGGAPGAPGGTMSPLDYEKKKLIDAERVKASQKAYEGINAAAAQYDRDLKQYTTLSRSLLNNPNTYSGAGGNISLFVNRVRAAFGDQTAAMMQEALQKVTATSVLEQINNQRDQLMEAGGTSSRIFSQQVGLVEKAAPQMATTLGGNRFLVEVTDRMGALAHKIAEMARDHLDTPGTVLDHAFDRKVARYLEQNPIFTERELAHPELLGAATAPPELARSEKGLMQWAKDMGLHKGDPVRFPDGSYKMVP